MQTQMQRFFLYFIFASIILPANAQKDSFPSLNNMLEEVVVTSTRTENKLGNVAVPVKIISKATIQQAGSLRLKDILQEQAGLFITNGFGAGVQMQGLNPDYTLILLNGEPMIGRTAGVLDINRISVGNIKKIEIVKGPSSSLYGSEAMAGVINIITDNSYKKNLEAALRYGFGNPDKGWSWPLSNNTFKNTDFNLQGAATIHKTGLQFSSNTYYLDGISYRPFSTERLPQPQYRISNQIQLNHPFSEKTTLSFLIRHSLDYFKQEFSVNNNGTIIKSFGREANNDLNINPVLTHQFNKNIKSSLRLYGTLYDGNQRLNFDNKPDSSYIDQFRQNFYRIENQTDIVLKKSRLTVGGGYTVDQARSTRYDNISNTKQNNIIYGFVQHEWNPTSRVALISGFRYDYNRLFAAAFSPKLAVRIKANNNLSFNASIGRGFKAPDFRQLYLNFTNNAAGGYSVLGSIDAVKVITQLQSIGQIAEIKNDFNRLSSLKPEFSTGINIGASYYLKNNFSLTLNLFRNDIEELIDSRQVATRTNGSQIFSYINIKNAYTQGAEIEANWQPMKSIQISSGYQLLMSADKEELTKIKNGNVYVRDPNGISRLIKKNEYVGLPNRSMHMFNLKLTYETPSHFFATTRFIYRSRWTVADSDGNSVHNIQDEHANGFLLINVSAGKELKNGLHINAGIDNLLNYQDANFMPNLQGRMIYIGVRYKLI
ncbi:MAG: TonB-dependent receptor [Ferruginibacter sp.]|nr:TonB-dependent receptor [Ferruginibacter sp.]